MGFMLGWLRERRDEVLRSRKRLVLGAESQPGDFIECQTCHERWEFDPARPQETSFERRFLMYTEHLRSSGHASA
jgi:hypothetical protein